MRDAIPRILSQLRGCTQPRAGQWQACCPSHKGGREAERSFGMKLREDGSILFHCFTGCTNEDVRRSLRLTTREMGPDEGAASIRIEPVEDTRYTPEECEAFQANWHANFLEWADCRAGLAKALMLPEKALELYGTIGARKARAEDCPEGHRDGSCWSFPQYDGQGQMIGFTFRFRDGSKKCMENARQGLFIPNGWKERAGPLYLPEGASDVLALTMAGCAAIGRFSVNGGVKMLGEFILANVPPDRPVIWLGENDRDEKTGDWPGRDAARKAALRLAADLGPTYTVTFAMPPNQWDKDIRKWMTGLALDGAPWGGMAELLEKNLRPERLDAVKGSAPKSPPAIPPHACNGLWFPSQDGADREELLFETGCNETDVNDAVVKIVAKDPELFVRANSIVRVIYSPAKEIREVWVPPAPMIDVIETPTLRERISRMVRFVTPSKRDPSQNRTLSVPEWCAGAIITRKRWDEFRYLHAVVEHPFLRPDGSLAATPGYDRQTGVFLYPNMLLPELPPDMTHEAAVKAIEQLREVTVDFPFEKPHHFAAWVCGLITPLARFAFNGPTPLFLVDSNTPGTGKGLLCHLASIILTGEEFPTVPYSHDDEEMRKKITSFAGRGVKGVMFDNIAGNFGGSVIDAMLTSTIWEDRILGSNTIVTLPMLMTSWATGNNVQVIGDGLRRIGHIRMNSKMERPEERTGFRHERVKQWVRENRPRLLGAALTILMAYCKAGRPKQKLLAWGSYEDWSDLVRASVVWAGLPDIAKGKHELRKASDPIAAAMTTLLWNWYHIDPLNKGMTTSKIIQKITPKYQSDLDETLTDFAEAVGTLTTRATANQLGVRFRQFNNRLLGESLKDGKKVRAGRKIKPVSMSGNAARWGVFDDDNKLVTLSSKDGEAILEGGEDNEDGLSPSDQRNDGSTDVHYQKSPSERENTILSSPSSPDWKGWDS